MPSLSAAARLSLFVLGCLLSFSAAQTTATSSAIPAATGASIYPGTSPWSYYGCYNETTLSNGTNGLRALNGGVQEVLDTMTVETCLAFCKSNGYAFAGLEYTRECYCAQYLSSISKKLPDSSCDLSCQGNSSQICGGNLRLSIYNAKSTKGIGIRGPEAPVGSLLALGVAIFVLLCLA